MKKSINKRPNIEDYKLAGGGYSQKYITDLEKHCNELENALDAACYILERFDNICHSIYPMTKKQWKKWLIEDEYTKHIILSGISIEKE